MNAYKYIFEMILIGKDSESKFYSVRGKKFRFHCGSEISRLHALGEARAYAQLNRHHSNTL